MFCQVLITDLPLLNVLLGRVAVQPLAVRVLVENCDVRQGVDRALVLVMLSQVATREDMVPLGQEPVVENVLFWLG